MLTTDQFCKNEYGQKLYKISFDAGMTCPNRDGKISHGGCVFCSEGGSGDFAVKIAGCNGSDLDEQISKAKERVSNKFKGNKFIAYFQAYSNTYEKASVLRDIFMPVIIRDDIAVLSIATRPDCLCDEIYDLLDELNKIKPVWVELGLQTVNQESIKYINRGYETPIYDKAISRLNEMGIHTITHVILYLPGENKDDMLATVRHAVKLNSKGIKLQLLHVLKNTRLCEDFANQKITLQIPSLDEYIETLKACLIIIPEDMVVHRLTGDPPKKILVEPKWAADKKRVLNAINNAILPKEDYFVYMIECMDGSYYTGSTNDVRKRFKKHSQGKGAKYTRSHKVKRLIYVERLCGKSAALIRECEIKALTKAEKENILSLQCNEVNLYKDLSDN